MIKSWLKRLYKSLFNKYSDVEQIQIILKKIIKRKLRNKERCFFVQIGSNDGKNGDPLFNLVLKHRLKGILVEPVPYIFKQLKNNYQANEENLFFENIAIGDNAKSLKFYRLKETDNLPSWSNQLGSFNKDIILTHKTYIPNIEEFLIEEKVDVVAFEELMQKYSVYEIALLHIDTEGHDYKIIKSIDFKKYHIENILFENKHLTQLNYNECIGYLMANGFCKIVNYGPDTFCSKAINN